MRNIGTIGDYTLIEDGFWAGTLDKTGKMHISPEMHYRSINGFADGVAIACQLINEKESMKWGLIDTEGNHISEFKYGFVEKCGEGYYRCEIGNKKNILRKDGTEVLKVWFNDVYDVRLGFFIIGNTIRKTKDHPTLYPKGLACVNGDIIFPPMFNTLNWNDKVKLDFFYAEKDGKPYCINKNGFIIDPAGDHLPKQLPDEDHFIWNGPKHTVCDGCIFTDGINPKGEGCRKLQKEKFRNNVLKGRCEYYKQFEYQDSYKEYWDKYDENKAKDKASKISDEYSVKLITDFIKDKLNNDLMNLLSFDFNELRNDEKYGNCNGFGFSPEKTNILKAIMTLSFGEAWPGINYDAFDHYDYEVAMVNTYTMLLGTPLGDNFKALREFRPSAEILDRAFQFSKLCHTVGNYMVLSGGMTLCRDKLRRSQRYIDTYLDAIHLAFTNVKKGNIDLLQTINRKKKIVAKYRSEDGFVTMCKNLLLEDYLDALGKPLRLFSGVWCDQKDLTRDQYFMAIEQYLDFCEPEIQKRSELIVKKLMEVLNLDSTEIAQDAIIALGIPKEYETLRSLPEDPDNSLSYGRETPNALCFFQTYPIDLQDAMPIDNPQSVIDAIHESLADNQGIIEVQNGSTMYEKKYIYSIVKSAKEPSGINYILTMHIVKKEKVLCIKGQFEERGTTGIRDTTVYEYALREKIIKEVGDKSWNMDPYDDKFTRGLTMNISEKREYDHSFPQHPLSCLRAFIDYIIQNN